MNKERLGEALAWCKARERGEPLSAACEALMRQVDNAPSSQPFVAWVYVLKAGEFYKIGVARDIEKRIADLQGGCPYEIEVYHAWPSHVPYNLEHRLHFRLRQYRVRREWFNMPESILRKLLSYQDIHRSMGIV